MTTGNVWWAALGWQAAIGFRLVADLVLDYRAARKRRVRAATTKETTG